VKVHHDKLELLVVNDHTTFERESSRWTHDREYCIVVQLKKDRHSTCEAIDALDNKDIIPHSG